MCNSQGTCSWNWARFACWSWLLEGVRLSVLECCFEDSSCELGPLRWAVSGMFDEALVTGVASLSNACVEFHGWFVVGTPFDVSERTRQCSGVQFHRPTE